MRGRIDWKHCLAMNLYGAGFDFSVLSGFRARLVEHGLEERALDVLLDKLRAAGQLDVSRATVDASHVQAKRGRSSERVGPSPVDRGCPGSKHHVLTDANGTPLRVSLTGGNRHDVTQLIPLVQAVPAIRVLRGRPRHVPRVLYADRAYDHDKYRRLLRARRITPHIARRGQDYGSGLGTIRWVAEAAIAWLHGPRELRTRWETRDDMHNGFLQLGCCTTLARKLPASAL